MGQQLMTLEHYFMIGTIVIDRMYRVGSENENSILRNLEHKAGMTSQTIKQAV